MLIAVPTNLHAPELLDACDRLGILVMDEKSEFSVLRPSILSQLSGDGAARDRNHPSVICWSICNEEAIQGETGGGRASRATMVDQVKQLDPSRPVTAAVSGGDSERRLHHQ